MRKIGVSGFASGKVDVSISSIGKSASRYGAVADLLLGGEERAEKSKTGWAKVSGLGDT